LAQHGFFIGQPISSRPIRVDEIADAPQDTLAPRTTIHRANENGLRAHLAALAIGALLVSILPALDYLDDDLCHAQRVSEIDAGM
jgi:hypothetical protein